MRLLPKLATAASLAAALGLTMTACDPSEPDPTPPRAPRGLPPPSRPRRQAPPSLTYKDAQIAAAQAFVEAYYAEGSAVGNDGYADWEDRLQPFFAGDPNL